MIKTLNELDSALNKQQVTFGNKQTIESHEEMYNFMATHERLDTSIKLKVDVNGYQILNELYNKDDKLYKVEIVYTGPNRFKYTIATEIIEIK